MWREADSWHPRPLPGSEDLISQWIAGQIINSPPTGVCAIPQATRRPSMQTLPMKTVRQGPTLRLLLPAGLQSYGCLLLLWWHAGESPRRERPQAHRVITHSHPARPLFRVCPRRVGGGLRCDHVFDPAAGTYVALHHGKSERDFGGRALGDGHVLRLCAELLVPGLEHVAPRRQRADLEQGRGSASVVLGMGPRGRPGATSSLAARREVMVTLRTR